MKSPAHDTALFIAALADFETFAGSDDWSVYVGREPLEPENVVTCYDTGGTTGPLVDLRHPTVQVRVRSTSYDAGWQKINAAYEALVVPVNTPVTDGTILGWVASGDVAFIGRDDKDRALFTANFELMRDGASTA